MSSHPEHLNCKCKIEQTLLFYVYRQLRYVIDSRMHTLHTFSYCYLYLSMKLSDIQMIESFSPGTKSKTVGG